MASEIWIEGKSGFSGPSPSSMLPIGCCGCSWRGRETSNRPSAPCAAARRALGRGSVVSPQPAESTVKGGGSLSASATLARRSCPA